MAWNDPVTGDPLVGQQLYEAKAQFLLHLMMKYGKLLSWLENPGLINPDTGQVIPGTGPSGPAKTFVTNNTLPALKTKIDAFWNNIMWADPFV